MWSLMLSVLLGLFVTHVFAQDKKLESKPGVVRVEAVSITAALAINVQPAK